MKQAKKATKLCHCHITGHS